MPADIDTNLQVQQQITQMLRTQNELYLAQARLMRGQLAMLEAMSETMGNIDVDRMHENIARTSEAIDAAEQALQGFKNSSQSAMSTMSTGAGESADAIDALGDSLIQTGQNMQTIAIGGTIFESLKKAANGFYDALGGITGLIGTIVSGIFDLGTALIAIPFGIFEELQNQAAAMPRSTEYAEAIEELRGQFGSLASNEGAAVLDMFHSLGRTLGDTDLSTRRILGNRAQQLREMTKLATTLGSTFNAVMNEGLVENVGNVVGMQKALAITDESMQMLSRTAITTGVTVDEAMREHGNIAIQMGKAFNISSMTISRDMQVMENDMKHFGGLSKATLGEVSVYAQKLGLDVKALTNIMETFDNFDSAADAAARLNQQFGIQLDTLEMLREEDPARRAEMLRDSLNAAGVSYENLDRRSKSYLASQIGISEAEAQLLFNQENRGLSLDDIKKKSEEAEKKQLSQVEVMDHLADAIQRLVKQGAQLKGNIFDNFIDGIMQGIFNSREMRTVLQSIAQVMRIAMQAGRELGRTFMATFPGIREIFGGFRDFFNPARWRGTFREVVDAFKRFFIDVSVNPETGMQTLFNRLKKTFFDHFDDSTSAGSRLVNGFKTFFKTIFNILVGAVKVILPEILSAFTEGLRSINQLLKGETGPGLEIDQSWVAIKTALGDVWTQMVEFFGNLYDTYGDDIWNGITSLFGTIWDRILPWFEENWTWVLGGLAAFFAGPAIINALTTAVGGLFGDLLGNLVGGAGGGGGLFGSLLGGLGLGTAGEAAAAGGQAAAAQTAVTATAETATAINDAAGGGGFEGLISNLAMILGGAEGVSIVIDKIFEVAQKVQDSGISVTSIVVAVGVMGAAVLGIYGIAEMLKGISDSGLTGGLITGAVAVIGAIIGGGALAVITTGISALLAPDGIFDQIFNLGARLANRAGAGAGAGKTGAGLMEIGGTLAALVTFLGTSVPLVMQIRNADLDAEEIRPTLDAMKAMVTAIGESANIIDEAIKTIDSDVISSGTAIITATVEAIRNLVINAVPPFAAALINMKNNNIDFNQANTFFTTLLTSISQFIQDIIQSDATIDAAKLKAVGNLAPLVTALGTLFSNFDELAEVFQTRTATTTNAAGAITTTVSNFDTNGIGAILYAIGGMIKRVLEGTVAFRGMDPAAIQNIGTSVAAISRSMLGGISEIVRTLMAPEVLELLGRDDYEERIGQLQSFLNSILETLFNSDSGFMKSMGDFIRIASTLVTSEAQANVVNAVAELMSTLLGGLNTLSRTIIDMSRIVFPSGAEFNRERLDGFLGFTLDIFNAMKTFIPDIVRNVLVAFEGVDVGRLQNKLAIVERIMTLLGTVVDLSDKLKDLSDEAASRQGQISVPGLQNIKNLFVSQSEGGVGLFDIIETIINNVKTLNVSRLPNLTGLIRIFANIATISESTSEIAGAGLNRAAGSNINQAFDVINGTVHHIKILKGRMAEINNANFSTLVTVTSQIATIAGSISSIPVLTANGINSLSVLLQPASAAGGGVLQQIINQIDQLQLGDAPTKVSGFNRLLARLDTTSKSLNTLNTNLLPIATSGNESLRTRVSDLMGTITDTVAAINNIGQVELNTTLNRLADNFGLGRTSSYTINNENFNLTINMRVVIDAGRFENVFYERAQEQPNQKAISGRFTTGAFVPEPL